MCGYNLNGTIRSTKDPYHSAHSCKFMTFVLEYMPNGELTDLIASLGPFPSIIARTYFRQIINGLEACHSQGIIHRDIKPQNILLDRYYNAKLCDFGLSKLTSDLQVSKETAGTPGYIAPEVLLGDNYNQLCDVFSAGIVLFNMVTSQKPFPNVVEKDKETQKITGFNHIYQLFLTDKSKFWQNVSASASANDADEEKESKQDSNMTDINNKNAKGKIKLKKAMKNLFEKMAVASPLKRISIEAIKKHSWYKNNNYCQDYQSLVEEITKIMGKNTGYTNILDKNSSGDNNHVINVTVGSHLKHLSNRQESVIPNHIGESVTDSYTMVKSGFVYQIICDFIKNKYKESQFTYDTKKNELLCKLPNLVFSLQIFISRQFRPMYVCKMQRLLGNGMFYGQIKSAIGKIRYGYQMLFVKYPDDPKPDSHSKYSDHLEEKVQTRSNVAAQSSHGLTGLSFLSATAW